MVLKSRKDGFTDREIRQAMTRNGVSDETIRRVFHSLDSQDQQVEEKNRNANPAPKPSNNQRATRPERDRQRKKPRNNTNQRKRSEERDRRKEGVLHGNNYKLKQKLLSITDAYNVYEDGELVLKARAKLLQLHEDIKFKNPDGEQIFEVKAEQITDIAGDYTLVRDGEPLTTLEKKFTIATHKWKIKSNDRSERLLAKVESRNPVLAWMRKITGMLPLTPNVFALIPHRYDIKTGNDEIIGKIEGKFSIRDTYILSVHEDIQASRDSIVASAIAIDALEGN